MPPPLFPHHFKVKVGRDICSNIHFVSYICPLPLFLATFNMRELDNHNHDESRSFLEEQQLHLTYNMEISGACVDTKLKGTKATVSSVVTGDDPT